MLRALIIAGCCLVTAADARAEDRPAAFAPGATGAVGVDVMGLMEGARTAAETLGQNLSTVAPADLGDLAGKIGDLEQAARNDPWVRALLGVDPGTGEQAAPGSQDNPGYGEARVLVFASLGMPRESLRQIFRDADRFGATVVLRGFPGNSVVKTGEVLREVMPSGEANGGVAVDGAAGAANPEASRAGGLAIDPTLFRRFKVEAVPVYVVLAEPLATCESQGCADDPLPRHDRISGNISLSAALETIARAKGDAAGMAEVALRNGSGTDLAATTSSSGDLPTGVAP